MGQPRSCEFIYFSFELISQEFTTSYQTSGNTKNGSDRRVANGLVQLFHDLFANAGTQKALAIGIKRRKSTL